MPVLKHIAAIAKGMSITFMEMFQPTTVENYPDGKGPLRGARIEAPLSRRPRAPARRKWTGEVCGLLPLRCGVPVQLHLH